MSSRTAPNSAEPADAARATPAGERIAKLLARAGVASRREVERMIAEGRVTLNGEPVDTPATVLRSLAGVAVDGQLVAAAAPARLFLYHKPVGLLVTENDPRGRPTIYDRLPADLPRVVPVGRLDLNTEGLLLLTTDGGLKRELELPATGVPRTYRARAYGQVSQAALEDLIHGIEIEGVRYGQIDANMERRTGANQWIELTLTEGKNREVRRVLEHLGLQVGRLIRTRYGPFVLGDLPAGELGEVRQHDLVAFRQALAGKRPQLTEPIAPANLKSARREPEPDQQEDRSEAPGRRPTARTQRSAGATSSTRSPTRAARTDDRGADRANTARRRPEQRATAEQRPDRPASRTRAEASSTGRPDRERSSSAGQRRGGDRAYFGGAAGHQGRREREETPDRPSRNDGGGFTRAAAAPGRTNRTGQPSRPARGGEDRPARTSTPGRADRTLPSTRSHGAGENRPGASKPRGTRPARPDHPPRPPRGGKPRGR
ncbi:pseudouridine synthase [Sphingomonas aerophila]|uniref:Pseudouridine synthase n=1 Tax=Sphingomonas aerophila TaxID=1344948 RepID=A0A7W9BAZ8_9SPHN|nr:pseudouridine synthase [Sphingomonas aerophila]MBB5713904.1 23S rRNA pseudouridine2605 synthase [Sphingomonas aerophila]